MSDSTKPATEAIWTLGNEVAGHSTIEAGVQALLRGLHKLFGHAVAADVQGGANPNKLTQTQAALDALDAQVGRLTTATVANTPPVAVAEPAPEGAPLYAGDQSEQDRLAQEQRDRVLAEGEGKNVAA